MGQRIEPHTLDVQRVINMLDKDKCPASMGAFTYPNGADGLVMILAKPEYTQRLQDFLQSLYSEAGYVSPVYPR